MSLFDDEYWEEYANIMEEEKGAYRNDVQVVSETPRMSHEFVTYEWEDDEYENIVHSLHAGYAFHQEEPCVQILLQIVIEDSGDQLDMHFLCDYHITIDDVQDNLDEVSLEEACIYIQSVKRISKVSREINGRPY